MSGFLRANLALADFIAPEDHAHIQDRISKVFALGSAEAEAHLKKRDIVGTGDVYAITCGEPMGSPGGTNMLKICRVA